MVKLSEYGLAPPLTAIENDQSIWYWAPEAFYREKELKRDVWSLGITLIELAEGRNPYASASLKRMVVRICNKDPPSLSHKKWSPTLVDFVSKCLVKNVKKRASVRVLMDVSDCEMVQA